MTGPTELPPAGVPPEEAIAFFRRKGYRFGFSWLDVFQEEHARAFTVAKAMNRAVLEDIREMVDKAIAEGITLDQFKRELRPKLEARGWWGKKMMLDPVTGRHSQVQLGSPARLKTIFNTNLRTAYAAGKWARIERTAAAFPYLEYTALNDGRERPQHHAWSGTILPVKDPWWDTHYPPCDWNCRCSVIQRSARMLERQGKTVTAEPASFPQEQWVNPRTGETGSAEEGIGRGWNYNVGKESLRGLAPRPWAPEPDRAGSGSATPPAPTRTQQDLFDRFTGHFGIEPGREGVWQDREGHPLAIGRGWFIGDDGAVRLPRGSAGVAVDRIAGAMTDPDSIKEVFVPGRDGRHMAMRRYRKTDRGITTIVEVGNSTWRWGIGRDALKLTDSASTTVLAARLSAAELAAIDHYTGPGYSAINLYSRGLHGEFDDEHDWDEAAWHSRDLDRAIAKGRLAHDMTLYRTLTNDGVEWIEGMSLRVGSTYVDPGFQSSTKRRAFADLWGQGAAKRLTLEIRARRGTIALDVTESSAQGTGEYEVLFPRNTKFRVVGFDEDSRTLTVETIDPEAGD